MPDIFGIIGLIAAALVYVLRLPGILRRHQDLPYMLCRGIAAFQGLIVCVIIYCIGKLMGG